MGAASVLLNASMTGGYLLVALPGFLKVYFMRIYALLASKEYS
jgi:hypothetical protein